MVNIGSIPVTGTFNFSPFNSQELMNTRKSAADLAWIVLPEGVKYKGPIAGTIGSILIGSSFLPKGSMISIEVRVYENGDVWYLTYWSAPAPEGPYEDKKMLISPEKVSDIYYATLETGSAKINLK